MSFKGSQTYRRFTQGRNKYDVFEGRSQHVFNDYYTGDINGSNRLFTTQFRYYPDSVVISHQGIEKINGVDFIESDDCASITLAFTPDEGESLSIHYRKLNGTTIIPPPTLSFSLREDGGFELREDGGDSLRE